MQPATISEAASRHALETRRTRVMAEEAGGEKWQAGIVVLELSHALQRQLELREVSPGGEGCQGALVS